MWFPPYELVFDENVSATWTKTEFIGRGEPLYTYNSTTRTGQLRFKMIVDHPRVVNGYRGQRSNAIERFFAGCLSPADFLNILKTNGGVSKNTQEDIKKKLNGIKSKLKSNTAKNKTTYTVFFGPEGGGISQTTQAGITSVTPALFTGNNDKLDTNAIKIFTTAAKNNIKTKVICTGFAGKGEMMASTNPNKPGPVAISAIEARKVSKARAQTVYDIIEGSFTDTKTRKFINKSIKSKGYSLSTGTATDEDDATDRRVEVIIENDSLDTPSVKPEEDHTLGDLTFYPGVIQDLDSFIINETNYFDFVDYTYPNYFANISEKIRYFHAGFHSTTPEGLNTRVTFLQQCMRQGPSINDKASSVRPQNLAFGRPPVLVLRIGDFFYTKIVCNSLNISYESGGNIQWDLNPSGIGVQPMVANVTMSIDIIGGQSLQGPINKLQNAVSYNFYANTEMYDARAESIKLTAEGAEIVKGLELGKLKEKALDTNNIEGGLELLDQSLKGEGVLNQEAAQAAAEAAAKFESQFGIKIENSASDIWVTSTLANPNSSSKYGGPLTLPSEMPSALAAVTESNPQPLKNNLLVVEVEAKYANKFIYKNIYKEEFNLEMVPITSAPLYDDIQGFLRHHFDGNLSDSNDIKIAEVEQDIVDQKAIVTGAENALSLPNPTAVSENMTNLKNANKELVKLNKKLEKLKERSTIDIKMKAYYSEDKISSSTPASFKFEKGKITKKVTN